MRCEAWPLGAMMVVVAVARGAQGGEVRPVELGATVGYALPAGSLESGSRMSDLTFGAPFGGLDAAYRVNRAWAIGASFAYGVTTPTLCATFSDCTSSLGHDETLALLGRWHVGRWGRFAPAVEGQIGYEWFSASLSDNGAVSERSYGGISAALAADALFAVTTRLAVGLRAELRGGVFHRATLVAPGIDASGPTEGPTLHLWPTLGARATATF